MPQRGKRYVIGLDVGVTNDRTAAVVAHLETVTDRGSPDRWNDNRGESEFLMRWRAERFGERRPVERQTEAVKVVVDRIAVWAGSRLKPVSLTEVTDWVYQAAVDYGGIVVFDPYDRSTTLVIWLILAASAVAAAGLWSVLRHPDLHARSPVPAQPSS